MSEVPKAIQKINMAVIGCGGRGRYDSRNLVATEKVEIVALADYFDFQMKEPQEFLNVSASRCFAGEDGYKQALALDDVDAVLLTTTPYYRPIQFKAAIEAGKHVFAEKPIAVDPWGCREFLATGKKGRRKETRRRRGAANPLLRKPSKSGQANSRGSDRQTRYRPFNPLRERSMAPRAAAPIHGKRLPSPQLALLSLGRGRFHRRDAYPQY